jgi:hypothetical protein
MCMLADAMWLTELMLQPSHVYVLISALLLLAKPVENYSTGGRGMF